MNHELVLSFFVAVVAIQVSLGPGMLFIIANGIAGGARGGIAVAI